MNILHEHEDDFDKQLAREIQDITIYCNAWDLATQLHPIAIALVKAKSDSHSIADLCHMRLTLQQNPLLETHCDLMKKCCKQTLTIEHLVVYKLYPHYQGEHLTRKQMEKVCEYLITEDSSFVAILISYQAEAAPFPPSFFLEASINTNPTTRWKAVEKYGMPHDFVELAFQLLSATASSAFIKRIFSSLCRIHTKIRNRLGNEKTTKLIFCHRILQGLCNLDDWRIKWMDSIVHAWRMWESVMVTEYKRYLQIIFVITELEKM